MCWLGAAGRASLCAKHFVFYLETLKKHNNHALCIGLFNVSFKLAGAGNEPIPPAANPIVRRAVMQQNPFL